MSKNCDSPIEIEWCGMPDPQRGRVPYSRSGISRWTEGRAAEPMRIEKNGKWVKASDYDLLTEERDALAKALEDAKELFESSEDCQEPGTDAYTWLHQADLLLNPSDALTERSKP